MNTQRYMMIMGSVLGSIILTPGLEDLVRVYIISVVVFITTVVNIIFRIDRIREYIVKRISSDVIKEILKDKDVSRIMRDKFSQDKER